MIVVVGCSHPGIERVMRAASRFGEIYGIIGGFHVFRRLEELRRVRLIVPCHCTLLKHKICAIYPETSMRCLVGIRIEI